MDVVFTLLLVAVGAAAELAMRRCARYAGHSRGCRAGLGVACVAWVLAMFLVFCASIGEVTPVALLLWGPGGSEYYPGPPKPARPANPAGSTSLHAPF